MVQHQLTATGLVFNEHGHILLIKHKRQGKWLPPGGHVEENELPCNAVAREVLEETGVMVDVLSSVPRLELTSTDGVVTELPLPLRVVYINDKRAGLINCIDLLYLCRAVNTETTPQEAEIDGIGWFSPEDALKMDTHDDIIKVIKSVLESPAFTHMR